MSQDQPGGRRRSRQLVDGPAPGRRPRDRARADTGRIDLPGKPAGASGSSRSAASAGGSSAGLSTRPQPVIDLTDSRHLRSSTPVPERGRSGWLLLLLPLVLTLAAGAWFGRSYMHSSGNQTLASASDGSSASQPSSDPGGSRAPGSSAAPSTSTSSSADLGKVTGRFTLKGPSSAPAGTVVVYVITGPKHGVHTVSNAPYDFAFDSRTIPNGTYSVAVTVIKPGAQPTTQRHSMQVANSASSSTPKASASTGTKAENTSTNSAPVSAGSGVLSAQAQQVLTLTNQQRAKAGCKALTANTALTKAAQAHSADMAQNNYFSHDSQDGTSPFTRIQKAGYEFSAAAENIAYGQPSAASVMDAWMNSAGHKANILNCTYTQIGIGYALRGSTPYWTQDFGTPL